MRLLPSVLLAALTVGLAGACAGQPPTVGEQRVEDHAAAQLTKSVGVAPDDIDCPGDLEGEVGTTMRCVLTAGDDRLGVTIEVTDVEGDEVRFDIEVDEEMMP